MQFFLSKTFALITSHNFNTVSCLPLCFRAGKSNKIAALASCTQASTADWSPVGVCIYKF
jgi:hypothetical protein